MSMSKDRVHFTIPDSTINKTLAMRKSYCDVLFKAFGLSSQKVPCSGDIKIICRPSQFARFLIYRNEAGITNGFRCLNPKLKPADEKSVLDVSENPHINRSSCNNDNECED